MVIVWIYLDRFEETRSPKLTRTFEELLERAVALEKCSEYENRSLKKKPTKKKASLRMRQSQPTKRLRPSYRKP